jgi:hypothetical protein
MNNKTGSHSNNNHGYVRLHGYLTTPTCTIGEAELNQGWFRFLEDHFWKKHNAEDENNSSVDTSVDTSFTQLNDDECSSTVYTSVSTPKNGDGLMNDETSTLLPVNDETSTLIPQAQSNGSSSGVRVTDLTYEHDTDEHDN